MPGKPKVLIIDDEPDYRVLLSEVLKANGWTVLSAEGGEQGIEMAKSHRPQVVLCDLLMPGCNGFQVCRALRQDDALGGTKVIVTSGRDFDSDRKTAFEVGANHYLVKPLDFTKLVELMSGTNKQARDMVQSVAITPAAPTAMIPAGPTRVRFWGVRGSIPTPGPTTVYFGGNTSCVEVRADGEVIILDAGSGLRLLGQELLREFGEQALDLTLLLTHTHWDHIQGIPFFLPVYRPQNHVRIFGYLGALHGLENVLSNQMEKSFFPVALRDVSANLKIEELKTKDFTIGPVRVKAFDANHPGICVGYRLFTSEGSVAFFPDNEPHIGHRRSPHAACNVEGTALDFARSKHQQLLEFLQGTDVLIMDTQYDCEEYENHVGWGHGCLDDVVALALEAQAKRLFLFHHDPNHDDKKIADMVTHARECVATAHGNLQVEAAREGLEVLLLPKTDTAVSLSGAG